MTRTTPCGPVPRAGRLHRVRALTAPQAFFQPGRAERLPMYSELLKKHPEFIRVDRRIADAAHRLDRICACPNVVHARGQHLRRVLVPVRRCSALGHPHRG